MNILFVYPQTPATFWSFSHAVKFVMKKSSEIPLGLLTVAAMLPAGWKKKLIDLNVEKLKDENIARADYVFIGGMDVHEASFRRIVKRCNLIGTKVVAGGPMVTFRHNEFQGVDHFILNEAEATLPPFIEDIQMGNPKKVYAAVDFPDLGSTPVPAWELLSMKKYAAMNIQYSRGCPFDCEFCSITVLNGRVPRTKEPDQFIGELESLYKTGWRGGVFIVDDNFIGNRKQLKNALLPSMTAWSRQRNYPFQFTTEASINLSEDEQLVSQMVESGFQTVFIGIETVNPSSLAECGKSQNLRADLSTSVRKLQRAGLVVSGGFIVGFDHDTPEIFADQISFIQKTGIVTAMVGLLNAPLGSKLFSRLKSENRILSVMSGNNTDGSINFIPKMDYGELIRGYRNILQNIYSPARYYERVKTFLQEYRRPAIPGPGITPGMIAAFFKTIWKLGIVADGRKYYWKLFFLSLFKYPRNFSTAITMAVYGFHFRRVLGKI